MLEDLQIGLLWLSRSRDQCDWQVYEFTTGIRGE